MLALLLALTADISRETILADRVARIEINHVMCPWTGRELVAQVIYWRWHADVSRHHVAAWRDARQSVARFRRTDRGWVETREDGSVRREIHATELRETWSVDDPEREDVELLAPNLRRGLKSR